MRAKVEKMRILEKCVVADDDSPRMKLGEDLHLGTRLHLNLITEYLLSSNNSCASQERNEDEAVNANHLFWFITFIRDAMTGGCCFTPPVK